MCSLSVMETDVDADDAHDRHHGRARPAGRLTADEARAALRGLDADGARLAQHMVTPWWYHPALGVIVAVVVAAQALPGSASTIAVALAVIAIPVLLLAHTRRYGISTTNPVGPRSRRLLLAMLGILLLAMVAGVVVTLSDSPSWWVLVPAALAGVAMIVLGRRYDDALRDEVARTASALP